MIVSFFMKSKFFIRNSNVIEKANIYTIVQYYLQVMKFT